LEFRSKIVSLQEDHGGNLDNTYFNFLNENGDILLHISVRRHSRGFVFNSRHAKGAWGHEEKASFEGVFKEGGIANITVCNHADRFDISIDGTIQHSFTKRIQLPTTAVAYHNTAGMTTSIFENTITVRNNSLVSPPSSYQSAYFQLTAADVENESKANPFDIVVIGSGIGGGVLACSLLAKNLIVTQSDFDSNSTPNQPKMPRPSPGDGTTVSEGAEPPKPLRILVIERGNLTFHTHSLNGPRPSNSGTTSQGNDLFFNKFKKQWDMDAETKKHWAGGAVYCLGGRGAVWGLFSPRVAIDTLKREFPKEIHDGLMNQYYRRAEKMMQIAYPITMPPHQAFIDRLNLKTDSQLPNTQWEWGRIASEFHDPKNYDFAEGAFSTIDTLLEAAMNDPQGLVDKNFRSILGTPVTRLEPAPKPGQQSKVTHVVIQDGQVERKIACKNAVLSAGSIESPAILLRSANGDKSQFGDAFAKEFGHVTDHKILAVTMPFFYRSMADRERIGGMKLQTDITFNIMKDGKIVDDTTALANIALDTVTFLPRNDASDDLLPMLVIAYIIPSILAPENKVELNSFDEPRIHVVWAEDKYLAEKEKVMKDFAVDIMNKMVAVLDVRFAKKTEKGYSPLLDQIKVDDIQLNAAGPGVVAHELGSIPMPNASGTGGIVDTDLLMKYGWKNVSVCDLSVFPYSPAANPTLTLTALALRLSDKLYPDPRYSPIKVFNLTGDTVWVNITQSRTESSSFGPQTPLKIASGESQTWKISQKEVMTVFSCLCSEDYNVQMVYPGINPMIVHPPPVTSACSCKGGNAVAGKSRAQQALGGMAPPFK